WSSPSVTWNRRSKPRHQPKDCGRAKCPSISSGTLRRTWSRALDKLKLSICVQTDEVPRPVPVALFTGSFAERARKAAAAGADGRRQLIEILRAGGDIAQRAGVRIALEPANRYELDLVNNAAEGLAFLAEADHAALGLLLDTFHGNIEETSWTQPLRTVKAAG